MIHISDSSQRLILIWFLHKPQRYILSNLSNSLKTLLIRSPEDKRQGLLHFLITISLKLYDVAYGHLTYSISLPYCKHVLKYLHKVVWQPLSHNPRGNRWALASTYCFSIWWPFMIQHANASLKRGNNGSGMAPFETFPDCT